MSSRFRPSLTHLLAALLASLSACVADEGAAVSDSATSSEGSSAGATSEASLSEAGSTAVGTSTGEAGSATSGSETTSALTQTSSDVTEDTRADLDECPRVRVIVDSGQVLNIRPDPSATHSPVGTLGKGAIVDVIAEVQGEAIDGLALWYQISSSEGDGYVWGGLVECTLDEAPELQPPGSFWLPIECGSSALVTQGNNGGFSHYGTSAYGFDFGLALGAPLVAIADGVVQTALFQTMPGDPCYNGGGQECGGKENLVTLLHGDGTTSTYVHLSGLSVGLGEFVPRGAQVGLVGSTGWSTGRHAHVQRQENCGWGFCQSLPVAFADVPGDGVPVTGQNVTSMNCP
ncbi:MAG: peptidoglycan DD-metalloendopeptidase family protein [Nannocystis sp.]|nr:peptidoglycan DD-metalloendopeptidase family protein [Nannocystis sp.]